MIKKILPQSFRDRYRFKWQKFHLEKRILLEKVKRQFRRPPIPKLEDGSLNLHLGCGAISHPKFINIDGLPGKHIHYIRQIDNLSVFQDKSVDLIYASHCLEHFSHRQIPTVLAEWFRVLKVGGILRLSVPDFDVLIDAYTKNRNEIDKIIPVLMGGQNYKYNFHMTVFTHSSLEKLLRNTGFRQIQEWEPNSSDLTTFDDCSNTQLFIDGYYYPVSLNIEAMK